ncbi:sugar phosphate nucleotidyltransferase [Deinococcus malanensis]|uniref:sugar phosphate nucleotidyltransferase n=1 Tax=Deinococcus malanensis TaxID=1706855 RepID=UPI00363C9B4F
MLLVLSADHVYRLDYGEVIEAHVKAGASVTMVTTELKTAEEATRFGNVQAGADGRVRKFAYKPEQPLGRTVTAEVFVYNPEVLLDTLAALQKADRPWATTARNFSPRWSGVVTRTPSPERLLDGRRDHRGLPRGTP